MTRAEGGRGPAQAQAGLRRVLRHRRFRSLWLGQIVSAIGDYFYFLALPILINALTGSTAAIGLAMIFTLALPQLLFGIPAGVLADRWDRRRVMIAADLVRACLVLGGLLVHDAQTVWILYAVGLLLSTASRFFYPAQSALIPHLVGEDELLAANGLSQMTQTAAMLVGPALAGFAIAWLGAGVAFVVDAASFLVSALAVWSIGRVAVPAASAHAASLGASVRELWRELVQGLGTIFGRPILRAILLSMSIIQLGLGAINVLWVPLLDRYYGVGPEGMGVLDSMQGVGMALGGLAVGWLAARVAKARMVWSGLAILGLMLALTGVAPSYAVIVGFTFILGLALAPLHAALVTLGQENAPDELRGRLFATLGTFGQVAGLISMGAAAGAAEWVGIPAVYLVCGGLVMVAGLVFGVLVREPKSEEGRGALGV